MVSFPERRHSSPAATPASASPPHSGWRPKAHTFSSPGEIRRLLDDAVASIGAGATGIRADVSNLDDLDNVADAIRARGRGLDVVFANAGGGELATLPDVTMEQFANTFQINVGGILFTLQKVLPLLKPGASIVLTGSTAAYGGTPAMGVYAASKAAIRSLGRTWAAELVDKASGSTPSYRVQLRRRV